MNLPLLSNIKQKRLEREAMELVPFADEIVEMLQDREWTAATVSRLPAVLQERINAAVMATEAGQRLRLANESLNESSMKTLFAVPEPPPRRPL